MRVLKGGQVIQEYRSRVPFDGEATAYYSFGTILEPGDYEVLVDITRVDNTLDGTLLFAVQVPALRLSDIVATAKALRTSTPVFYSDVRQLQQPETMFTVVKNKYENGPASLDFFPWGDRPFRSSDKPILTFFVLGAAAVQGAEPWNISAALEIRSGKESVAKFEAVKLANPVLLPADRIRQERQGQDDPAGRRGIRPGHRVAGQQPGRPGQGRFRDPFPDRRVAFPFTRTGDPRVKQGLRFEPGTRHHEA